MHGDRRVKLAEPLLEFVDNSNSLLLGLDDGELAELDSGACHHRPAPVGWLCRQSDLPSRGDQGVDLILGQVENKQLLQRGSTQPVGTMGFCDLRQPYQGCAARATCNAGQPDEVPAVMLKV